MDPLSIPLTSIDFEVRRAFGDLSGLQDSLRRLGTIHPPVLSQYTTPEGLVRYKPVAGRRRLAALKAIGATELYHNSVLDPERPGFQFKEEVPEDELREAELDENLYRLQPKWQEDCVLVAEVHSLKRKTVGHKWGQRQTAAMLGPGYGTTSVNYALKLAKYIRDADPEITACKTMMEGLAVLTKRKEDEALKELTNRSVARMGVIKPPTDTSSFLDTLSIKTTKEVSTCATPTDPKSTVSSERRQIDNGQSVASNAGLESNPLAPANTPITPAIRPVVPLSSMFQRDDTITALWPMVDHIVTDIPYGIDMDNLEGVDEMRSTHDVDQNIGMMPTFLTKAFASVKPGGFCVFFYDLDHHEKLQGWATAAGWKVQRWPFIAVKSSPCRNGAAQYNTTKNYECAMLLRKDSQTVLRKQVPTSWREYNFAAERSLYSNPFAKPFALWKDIYDMIAFPGQSVLDPFAGEMSACRAAANCGLIPYGIEIDENRYNRGLQLMKGVYALIHKSNVDFT